MLVLRGTRRWMLVLVVTFSVAAILSACSESTNTYWYCWDTGNPSPHHLGHPVSGDHLCSDSELAAARAQSSTASQAAVLPTPTLSPPTATPAAPNASTPAIHTGSRSATQTITTQTLSTLADSTPTVPAPTPAPIPKAPDSKPVLTGPVSASSDGYSVTIKSVKADHNLDIAGYNGPPSLGIAVEATCSEPGTTSVVTWKLSTGSDPTAESIATCFQGSFNPDGIAQTFAVIGCGSHVLTVTPQGFGDSIGDTTEHPLAAPMTFPLHVC